MKILFVTTLSFATNPRLRKEIYLALNAGYLVEILAFEFHGATKKINDEIKYDLEKRGATIHLLNASFNISAPAILSKSKFLMAKSALPIVNKWHGVSDRSAKLFSVLNKISRPDFIIGHNPGALWPVAVYAEKWKVPCGFDMEDYHPGESADSKVNQLQLDLLVKYLPKMNYVSFASEGIKSKMLGHFLNEPFHSVVVNNFFSSKDFKLIEPQHSVLKIVWFSQNINAGRGLEPVIDEVKNYEQEIEFHLVGNLNQDLDLKGARNVFTHAIMTEAELHVFISNFDIGLVADTTELENRGYALTNKICAYTQAGLYVLAYETSAHAKYFSDYGVDGRLYRKESLHDDLVWMIDNSEIIKSKRAERYHNGTRFNWESESKPLIRTWQMLLGDDEKTAHHISALSAI